MKTQRTKLFGLKKLRKIVQFAGSKGNWYVSPHKAYNSPKQFRLSHSLGRDRLLVRTDEIGKTHNWHEWMYMPRGDFHLPKNLPASEQEQQVRQECRDYLLSLPNPHKLRIIAHPTFAREQIHLSGEIKIEPVVGIYGQRSIFVQIKWGYPEAHNVIHRNSLPFKKTFFLGKKRVIDPKYANNDADCTRSPDNAKHSRMVISSAEQFVRTAIASGQLRMGAGRRAFSISFLTWKNNPKSMELFDLIESVDTHNTKPLKDTYE
ncbi:MAG: hypothetical protein NTY48_03255 [Candidatus Diapherotrites archaeon]|nr:hypothetical protein [Candidatus Diapherotrites archaeon]